MQKHLLVIIAVVVASTSAFAVDGVVLINQSTVAAAGAFPYRITQPGSYRLSGNLIVTTPTVAIDIQSDNVTLDLNGFTINGPCTGPPATCTGAFEGVSDQNTPRKNITLKNGVIRNFFDGVFLPASGGMITDLQSNENVGSGIYIPFPGISMGFPGAAFIIVRCSANNNGLFGVVLGAGTISTSTANNNADGFIVFGATVSDSIANGNADAGFTATTSALTHNIATNNGYGLFVNSSSVFGSSVFVNNAKADVKGGTSQNNSVCTSGSC